ncbi:MAG: AI-2E family transporter [Acidobacteriota bacterium]|nr:AI-2E family transporter [Acidobacteriota bacterium]
MIDRPEPRVADETSETEDFPPLAQADFNPSIRTVTRIVLTVLGILLIVLILGLMVYWLSGLILLIVLAIFFAYLVAPLVEMLQRPFVVRNAGRWMPRSLAIGIIYLFIFAFLWAAAAYLFPLVSEQVTQFAQQAPTYAETIRTRLNEVNRRYQRLGIPPAIRQELQDGVTRMASSIGEYATAEIGNILLSLAAYLPWLILIPILSFFVLRDAELFRLAAVRAFPRGRMRGRAELFFQDINKTLRAYMRAQLISCFLIGTICTVGFYAIGVNYALLLGLLAAAAEFIPMVGPLTIAILATVIAGLESSGEAIAVVIFLGVLRILQDYVFYPRIVGEGVHLHPLAIILAILGGGELAGATGIFLAIPVVAIVTVTYRHLLEHRGSRGIVAELLDEGKTDLAVEVAARKLKEIGMKAQIEENKE